MKCLLSLGAESVVFQVAIQKLKDQDIYRTIILPVVLYGCSHPVAVVQYTFTHKQYMEQQK